MAKGDKEKEARLTVAACALVHCSAQIPEDSPEYAKAKALEELGNTSEYASERALLSKQTAYIGHDALQQEQKSRYLITIRFTKPKTMMMRIYK
ncbi:Uncharacterised protein [Actinobacillus equuli]|nr:Uncharacterised protein [Actinobacillus equuli]